jgi:beta-lactamase superfamily II metal-dependent hydrolase
MADQLLIRAYNVGCGDCTYVRIPGPKGGFNILIDCGKKGSDELLKQAIDHLEIELPAGSKPGTRRLDLIVATHRHEDHIKGFDPKWFKNIQVKNVWLSVAMDPKHPQAKGVNGLHAYAMEAMRALADSGQALSPEADLLASMYGVSNDIAGKLLMETLPAANGITPRYVHSGMTHGLALPADTDIHILAPEKDVDHFYLGEELDRDLNGLRGISNALARHGREQKSGGATPQPANISPTDFRVLKSRMLSNGLAFAAKESSIQNNLSVVLLIEWKKRRLLFVGDAEWDSEFRDGKHNGSWNVMWEKYRKTHLKEPVDFLKIGHHGSINATPPPASEQPKSKTAREDGIYTVLDTILPVPKSGKKPTATAIVSTEREFYNPIPECKLLVDLAHRVSNTRDYGALLKKKGIDPKTIWATPKARKNMFFERYERDFLDTPQPLRTDLEFIAEGRDFVDVEIPPG